MAAVTIGAVLAAVAVLWFLRVGPFRPALTCAGEDPQVCQDTLEWVGGFDPNRSLYPPLPGRIAAIEVRYVPPQWAKSLDPEYRDAEWAALLHRDGYAPVLVACGYGSGDEVLCSTQEGPFARESPALTDEEFERAVSFREKFGLRSDEAWVLFVASQPDHDNTYSVPLTKAESQGLTGRVEEAQGVVRSIEAYGERHRDAWAGAYIDQRLGALVVGQFTKDLQTHEAAIRKFISPDARWQLHPVEFTLVDLTEAKESIAAERDWAERHGFDITGLGIDKSENRVLVCVEVSPGTDPVAFARHVGNDARIRIDSRTPAVSGGRTATPHARTSCGP